MSNRSLRDSYYMTSHKDDRYTITEKISILTLGRFLFLRIECYRNINRLNGLQCCDECASGRCITALSAISAGLGRGWELTFSTA